MPCQTSALRRASTEWTGGRLLPHGTLFLPLVSHRRRGGIPDWPGQRDTAHVTNELSRNVPLLRSLLPTGFLDGYVELNSNVQYWTYKYTLYLLCLIMSSNIVLIGLL